jgi:hypothetical protein
MSLTYALEAAINGTTGPRATLFSGSIAPSGDGVDPDDNQRQGFSPRRGGQRSGQRHFINNTLPAGYSIQRNHLAGPNRGQGVSSPRLQGDTAGMNELSDPLGIYAPSNGLAATPGAVPQRGGLEAAV